MYHNNIHTTL